MTLDETVGAIQARAPYISCATSAPTEDGWLSCATLIGDPACLRAEIEATATGRGTDDDQVLTSVFVQSYAFRVASVAVAAFALGLPGPSVAPEITAVRITRNRPGQLAVTDERVAVTDPVTLAHGLLEMHMRPFIGAVRATTRVGARMLWGNTAASIATVFRAVHGEDDPAVRERAQAFDDAAAPWLAGHGAYALVEAPAALGWYWNRTNCCLWYRTSSGYCDDCSLPAPADRDARRLAELTAAEA